MQTYHIPNTDLNVSRIGYGCMKLGGSWDDSPLDANEKRAAVDAVEAALEQGINFFDHADIYALGKSEKAFSQVLKNQPGLRGNIIIQSKCGIRLQGAPGPHDPQRYDFSYEHIIKSVHGSLQRLQTDYLDILLLHRPDPLVQPEEVARAFDELHKSGQVRYFGVSNHTPGQIELLQKYVAQPLVINQVELSLLHAHLIDVGVMANQVADGYAAAAGTLDYCRLKDIMIQAWSPVALGQIFNPPKNAPANVRETAQFVEKMAAEKQTTKEAVALAWLLRHPAGIQPIIGSIRPGRIAASAAADSVAMSREEWYALFTVARGATMP